MPNGYEPTRGPLLKRMLFGDSARNKREEKVLQYVIHRMSKDERLHDVIQEDYVRRNSSQSEIERIANDPELVHACREHLWRTFESGELDPSRVRRGIPPGVRGSRIGHGDAGDPASPTA